jgi:phage-related protein
MNNAEVLIKFKGDTSNIDKATDHVKNNTSSKLGSVAKGIGKAFVKGTAVASAAMVGMVAKGVQEYAKLEQSIGGVETLFKDSADTVIANAKRAYETAGVDANSYMEQVTSFSASLLQAVGGDTVKAAETADMAIIDMADNANKMGTSMEMIQNAYQGFAKQNYMMLDNLKLGYGGTRTEMLRLLADAEKISGIKYDISNLNDVYQAIHVIQKEMSISGYSTEQLQQKLKDMSLTEQELTKVADDMGISYEEALSKMNAGTLTTKDAQVLLGTTAKEASSTIQGSFKSMQSAFTNFLSGAGGIEEVIDSVVTFADNLIPAIVDLAPKIIDGLIKLINAIVAELPKLIKILIPPLLDGITALVKGILEILPELIQVLLEAIIYIVNYLANEAPTLVPIIVDAIMEIIPVLMDELPLFIKAGWQLLIGLTEGIIKAIPTLLSHIPGIAKKCLNALKSGLSSVGNIGRQMIQGLWNGMAGLKDWVINKVASMGKSILKGLKSVLGIHSPSTEFAMIGKFSVLGFNEALQDMSKDVDKQIASTFGLSPQLTGSMQNSFSPNVQVYNNVNVEQDPLGQMVKTIKTYSGGSPNDYNYGAGV